MAVSSEYGPTLVELAAPRWRALSPAVRLAVSGVAALLLVAAAVAAIAGGGSGRRAIVVRTPFAFNLAVVPGIHQVRAQAGEALRLQSGADRRDLQTYVVRPLRLPPYHGDVSAGFLIATARMADDMARADPAFVYRGEGRVRVNALPGYQIFFTTQRNGVTAYGRRVLLVPDEPGARDGADITLVADRSAAVPNVAAVGNNGLLKTPLRSFRFGVQTP